MNKNIGKEILKSPREFLAVANKEQILEAYPDWFKEINVGDIPFYLERKPGKRILPGHRYVITPSGLVRLEGPRGLVWKISEEDEGILTELNVFACEEQRKLLNGEVINNSLNLIEVDNFNLGTAFIPYGKEDVIKDAVHELEKAHAYDSVNEGNVE